MEFRRLTASDLESLLTLYKQLDADDVGITAEDSGRVWKEIESKDDIRNIAAERDLIRAQAEAQAVAGEAGVNFLSYSGADFVEMFVGLGARRCSFPC